MNKVFSFLLAGAFIFGISCTGGQKKTTEQAEEKSAAVEETVGPNELTQKEKEEGWVLLWIGRRRAG